MYCNPTRNEYLERRFRLTFCRILGKITDANRRGKRIVYVWNASERRRLVKALQEHIEPAPELCMKIQRISALKIKERTTAGRTSAVLIRVVPRDARSLVGKSVPAFLYRRI